ncbi:ribonuclease H-like domain-containing protein [Tanacetum coccineum]
MTHPHPKRSFVPQAVLTKLGKLSTDGAAVNTVRPVNTANTKAVNTVRSVNIAASKPIVNHPKTKTNAFKREYSQSSRPFNKHFANKNSIINTNVNTARGNPTTKGVLKKKEFVLIVSDSKGIKREFSMARTPQQNGVAERKNRTLIKAARTMLVDSKLPTTFWAEAVNTACYVLNRVLVIKPHNKTPYELIHGRPPQMDFMKPFGCPVTILSTREHLDKLDGKADEGYFVGYSVLFFDSDYAGASIDRKSTTEGCQYLSKRLISWQFKKQTVVANSRTEAEYVAAANYCKSKEVWGDSMIPHLVAPLKKFGDNLSIRSRVDRNGRAATTASSLEAEQDNGSGPRCQDTILGDVDAQTKFETTSKLPMIHRSKV